MNERVGEYLARITSMLRVIPGAGPRGTDDPGALSAAIFSILTSREFCYLGRTKTEAYRESVMNTLADDIRRGEPVRF